MKIGWNSPFDKFMAEEGPAAIFTLDHDGNLNMDVVRSRDFWQINQPPFPRGDCHCLLRDRQTGWPQYALITSPQLCVTHPRADIEIFADQDSALLAVAEAKQELFARSRKS